MGVQKILRGSTQSILSYPQPDGGGGLVLGVPSAPYVRFRTASSAMAEEGSEAAATVDSISATTTGEALKGATSLVVTVAKTWVRGRKYLATLTTGERVPLTCALGGSSTTFRSVEPFPVTIPSGSTISGIAITHALTTADTEDVGYDCLAIFKATIDGLVYTWGHPFEVVRRVASWPVIDVTRELPALRSRQTRNDVDFSELQQNAIDQEVLPRLAMRGVRDDQIVSTGPLRPVVLDAMWLLSIIYDPKVDQQEKDNAEKRLGAQIDRAFGSPGWWEAEQVEFPPPPDPSVAIQRRTVRLTR